MFNKKKKQAENVYCALTILGGVIAGVGLGLILSQIWAGLLVGFGVGMMVAKSKRI